MDVSGKAVTGMDGIIIVQSRETGRETWVYVAVHAQYIWNINQKSLHLECPTENVCFPGSMEMTKLYILDVQIQKSPAMDCGGEGEL